MSERFDDELSILLVEDNPGDARLIEHYLTTDEHRQFTPAALTHVEALGPALEQFDGTVYDLVLLDLGLPESTGLGTLERYNDALADDTTTPTPVVVLTGLEDDRTALEAIERGAQDYLVKDNLDGQVLDRTIRYALERHRKQRELERQNERLEKFAGVVSHDLRNPLNVAKGRIQMVDDEQAPVIERNLDRMEEIIDDVLTLAREGQAVDETDPVSVARAADRCWEQVDTAGATLTVDDDATVPAERNRLRQLLENLFRNSVEHAAADVSVRVGATENGFFVADDGPGIPADEREDVFDAGYTTSRDGTGFGLNIVAEIAQAHGWEVSVTDSRGGGARFEFTPAGA